MRYLLTVGIALGLGAVSSIAGIADDRALITASGSAEPREPGSRRVAFQVVTTASESLLEVKIGKVVFLTPYLRIPPNGGWPGEGEIHPSGNRVSWTNVKGSQTIARRIAFRPQTKTFGSGDRNSDAIADQLRFSASTKDAEMIEVRSGAFCLLVPNLRVPRGDWLGEGQMRRSGDTLQWKGHGAVGKGWESDGIQFSGPMVVDLEDKPK